MKLYRGKEIHMLRIRRARRISGIIEIKEMTATSTIPPNKTNQQISAVFMSSSFIRFIQEIVSDLRIVCGNLISGADKRP